ITRAELVRRLPAIAPELAGECIALLLAAGAVAEADDDGLLPEDRHPALAQREFHDVLMHSRSRYGMGGGPTGATFSFAGIVPPQPALKPAPHDRLLPLPRPDLVRLASCDPPLVTTMETRQSLRRHGSRPLSFGELGEFLYRVGRVRDIKPATSADPHSYETTHRTYPSGGAVYDLEIYLVARQCAGVTPGMYHYEPSDHALSLIQQDERILKGLLRYAYMSSGFAGVPQALFVISSRFTRLSWKYRGIAYATTLRNVGVLYEAMYLAATAMGLAPCALGGGNSQLFAEATALDPLTESSVGEFMLGTVAG
ncbi:MAG: SagB family peptide dehydrogenase, partial [Streptosporangiaceae bacterium]|nr:SagB family peptide dehydrogenase [Streptosporangiaceae bacterium]